MAVVVTRSSAVVVEVLYVVVRGITGEESSSRGSVRLQALVLWFAGALCAV